MNWTGVNNGWVKNFADGSEYFGLDEHVKMKKASWRNSRNTEIVSVGIKGDGQIGEIYGPGEYWQADAFAVALFSSSPRNYKRFIQKKIDPTDRFIRITSLNHSRWGAQYFAATFSPTFKEGFTPLTGDHVGHWFTVELDLANRETRSFFSKGKV
jgi:hypothetical protein